MSIWNLEPVVFSGSSPFSQNPDSVLFCQNPGPAKILIFLHILRGKISACGGVGGFCSHLVPLWVTYICSWEVVLIKVKPVKYSLTCPRLMVSGRKCDFCRIYQWSAFVEKPVSSKTIWWIQFWLVFKPTFLKTF